MKLLKQSKFTGFLLLAVFLLAQQALNAQPSNAWLSMSPQSAQPAARAGHSSLWIDSSGRLNVDAALMPFLSQVLRADASNTNSLQQTFTGQFNLSNANITGGTITGITDLAVADGGTGASSASGARTNLGLGSIATQAESAVAITGGTINGTSIGQTTRAAVSGTTGNFSGDFTASGSVVLGANGSRFFWDAPNNRFLIGYSGSIANANLHLGPVVGAFITNAAFQWYWNDGQIYPALNNDIDNGTTSLRWKSVNSVLGDFSGLLTATGGGSYSGTHAFAAGSLRAIPSSTDNAIVRFDGVSGAVQNSGITVADGITGVVAYAKNNWTTGGQPNEWIGDAGNNTLSGVGNYGWGLNNLEDLTTGYLNVAIGEENLINVTTGIANTAIGESNGMWITSGSDNVIIGSDAGGGDDGATTGITSGSQNVAIGNNAGTTWPQGTTTYGLVENQLPNTGSNNIAIGRRASWTVIGGVDPLYQTAIGSESINDSHAQVMLGRPDGSDKTTIPGNIELRRGIQFDLPTTWTTTPQTLNDSHSMVFVNTSPTASGMTVNLDATPDVGQMTVIKDIGGTLSTKNLTISRNGKLIDGAASNVVLSTNYASRTYISDGTNWFTLASFN